MKYMTNIYWSDEDECFIATVPQLPGCVSHGDTIEDAASNITTATRLWLASAQQHGDPIPEPDVVAAKLTSVQAWLNLSGLARATGINRNTLASKLRRGSRFTEQESRSISKVI